jgi:hypothetical protein
MTLLKAATNQRAREGKADWEDLAYAVVRCRVHELVRVLQLLVLVVTNYKCSINTVTNRNPVSSPKRIRR